MKSTEKTIARQDKVIAEQAKTIAALKKDNREQKRTIKQLRESVSRLEKSLYAQSLRTTKAEKALDKVLARLNVADNAHTPTSRQIMRETRKDQAVEDKKKTADRPGPPRMGTPEPPTSGPPPTGSGPGCLHATTAAAGG